MITVTPLGSKDSIAGSESRMLVSFCKERMMELPEIKKMSTIVKNSEEILQNWQKTGNYLK